MKRSVNNVAVIIAGMAFSALGCASGSNFWNPLSSRYSDDTKFKVARIQEQENKLGKARQMYEELLRENPKDVKVLHRLAIVSARMNEPQQSDRYFQAAIRLAPGRADLRGDYGYSLFLRQDLKGAEQNLRQAVAIEPTNKRAVNNLAIVLGHQGRAEESLAAFRRVVGEAEAQANLGYIHVQRGEGRQAVARYNRALEIDKNLHKASHALLQLAKLEQRYLQTDRAKQMIVRKKTKRDSIPEASEVITSTRNVGGKSIPVETTPIQLTSAKQPETKSPEVIRQANHEELQSLPKQPISKMPTTSEKPVGKPEWLQDVPAKKQEETPKVSAAAPFPQVSEKRNPVTTKPRAEPPKPVIQHADAIEPQVKPVVKSDVPTFEPKPQSIQQMSFSTVAKEASDEKPVKPSFKLTPSKSKKEDPAFRPFPTQPTNPRPTVTPVTVAITEPKPAEIDIPVVSDSTGKQGFVPTRSHRLDQQSGSKGELENPFAKQVRPSKPVDRPAHVQLQRDPVDKPARVQLHSEPTDPTGRISLAPQAARVRLSAD